MAVSYFRYELNYCRKVHATLFRITYGDINEVQISLVPCLLGMRPFHTKEPVLVYAISKQNGQNPTGAKQSHPGS